MNRGFLGKVIAEPILETQGAGLRLCCTLLQGTLMGLNEVTYGTHDNITESDISMVGDRLEQVLFVRGNSYCHDPIASFRHREKVRHKCHLSIKITAYHQNHVQCMRYV